MVNGFRSLCCTESAIVPLLVYALTKLLIPTKNGELLQNIHKHLLRVLLALIITPLLYLTILIFAFYFEFAKIIAKLHFGPNYHDNFVGADAVWTYNTWLTRPIIHVMHLFANEQEVPENMLNLFRNPKIQDVCLKNHPRLSCLRKDLLGYSFFIKTEIDYQKTVRYMDDYNTLKEFHEIVNNITGSGLPYNDEFLWEILIGKTAVEIEPGKYRYPMIMRFHHSITDGLGLIALIASSYLENGDKVFYSLCERMNQVLSNNIQKDGSKSCSRKTILERCKTALNTDIFFNFDFVHHKEQENVLHTKLFGGKVVGFSQEKYGDNLIQKIKTVKNVLKVAYNDVLLSAVSAAVSGHYQKCDSNPPTHITSLNPYYLHTEDLRNLLQTKENGELCAKLGNKFSVGCIHLPVDGDNLSKPRRMIEELHKTTQDLKRSMDFSLIYWMFNIFYTVVPRPFPMLVADYLDGTLIITNIPSAPDITYRYGYHVEDLFVWTNHFNRTGVSVSFCTYNNRLSVSTQIDSALVKDWQSAQVICNDIFRYIQIMFDETNSRGQNDM